MDLKFVTDKDGKKEGIKPITQISILRKRLSCHIGKTRNSGLEERGEDIFSLMAKKELKMPDK